MKTITHFFAAAIMTASASLANAQNQTDSIKVYYEPANHGHHAEPPEYYVDSILVKNAHVEMFNPNDITKIDVVKEGKGKIYITLKKDVPYKFVTLQSLSKRYLKSRAIAGVLYTIDGKLTTDAEALINEKNILSVSIATDQMISSLPSGKVTIFKILTKSKLNIENANKIYIRGNTLGSR